MKKPFVFISYRRDDEGPTSRFIKAELDKAFGLGHVFMDMDNIRTGDNWKNIIDSSLQTCDCLIAIIGKNWLRLHDENYMRRLDKEDDWVRVEIETALKRKVPVIPVLVGGKLPKEEALPESLQMLLNMQAMSISALTWQNDTSALIDLLESFDFKRSGTNIRFPDPKGIIETFPLAMDDSELEEALKNLDGWKVSYAPIPGKAPKQMQEISKKFEFVSFEDALKYMAKTQPYISKVGHHPRWENLWKTLVIHMSTWDIGYKVSKYDIELAHYFNEEYKNFYS